MLTMLARILGLLLAGICIYLLIKETGVDADISNWIQENTRSLTTLFTQMEIQRYIMAGIYLLGAIVGLLLVFMAGKRT